MDYFRKKKVNNNMHIFKQACQQGVDTQEGASYPIGTDEATWNSDGTQVTYQSTGGDGEVR